MASKPHGQLVKEQAESFVIGFEFSNRNWREMKEHGLQQTNDLKTFSFLLFVLSNLVLALTVSCIVYLNDLKSQQPKL